MSDEAVKAALKQIFVNPEVSQRAVDLLVPSHTKPSGWSRRSNAPYFREEYALPLKLEIDKMMNDGEDRVWRYDQWPHMTANSVYLRINQSIRYILTFMDKNSVYARFFERVTIKRKRGYGVEMKLLDKGRDIQNFSPQSVIPTHEAPKWQQRIEHWLEHSEPGGEPFVLENLMLSPEEVKELKLQFHGLTSVQYSITATTIKLIKVTL